MKKLIASLVAGLFVAGAAQAADPVEGMWQTEVDDGSYAYIDVRPCADKICGWIKRTFNSNGEYASENLGKMLVINMEPQGNNHYTGNVWRPSNDKIYIGKIDLDGNTLYLKGCVAGGLLCSKQTWKRVSQ
ncbi:MAG: DUF2147 domain-containing protein [Rhodobacteraceae bacterium]|nr:DUF2147 domain-containing protein [Paracoccaceae bacterium]MCB1368457.1 DUF2147 domain-containing protein [Paracoccaceae bacterium]